jgi:hypothetical protein
VGIGSLGVALPTLLLIGTALIPHCHSFQTTISHYYFTPFAGVFVTIMCAAAVLVFLHSGYDYRDILVAKLTGLAMLGVAIFPTSVPGRALNQCSTEMAI